MVFVRRLLLLGAFRDRVKPVPAGAYLVIDGVYLTDENGNKLTA